MPNDAIFEVGYEMTVSSLTDLRGTMQLAETATDRGIEVIIAGAGRAAHLAGVIAAHTILPVIGVPIDGGPLNGVDALYSTVQMPPGIPVATLAFGAGGARNAGILAVQILALKSDELRHRLLEYKDELAKGLSLRQSDCLRLGIESMQNRSYFFCFLWLVSSIGLTNLASASQTKRIAVLYFDDHSGFNSSTGCGCLPVGPLEYFIGRKKRANDWDLEVGFLQLMNKNADQSGVYDCYSRRDFRWYGSSWFIKKEIPKRKRAIRTGPKLMQTHWWLEDSPLCQERVR